LANSKTQNAFLFPVHAMFLHDCPLVVKPASMPRRLVYKKMWRGPLAVDMLLSAVCLVCCAAEFGSSGGTYRLPSMLLIIACYNVC
jgi:hypothetical protein